MIIEGTGGTPLFIVLVFGTETTPQMLVTLTAIFPPANAVVKVTVIEFVADVPDAPGGNVHEYEAAPATGATLYVSVCPGQAIVLPVIWVITEAALEIGVHFVADV